MSSELTAQASFSDYMLSELTAQASFSDYLLSELTAQASFSDYLLSVICPSACNLFTFLTIYFLKKSLTILCQILHEGIQVCSIEVSCTQQARDDYIFTRSRLLGHFSSSELVTSSSFFLKLGNEIFFAILYLPVGPSTS